MTATATSPAPFLLRVWASLGLLLLATAGGGAATTAERVATYGASVRSRLAPACEAAGVAYPPTTFTLIGLKAEKRLELWAPDAGGRPRLIKAYPILAASGGVGPKLREGDRQVPEGLYGIESLNPNSRYHLSLRVDYPNAADRRRAQAEGRTGLGGDIMIHGSDVSIGCLAMGDPAAEELFVLAALTGPKNIRVILSPVDFRRKDEVGLTSSLPVWVPALHAEIKAELARYR
jgi:murein L,D-transpeptidase YafK